MTDSQRVWALIATAVIAGLIYLLAPILSPFVISALLAYLFDPLVDRIEARGIHRTLAVVAIFLLFVLLVILSIFILIPLVGDQFELLKTKLPAIMEWFYGKALPWIERVSGYRFATLQKHFSEILLATWNYTDEYLKTVLTQLSSSGLAIFGLLGNLVLIPVVTFYLLRDWDILLLKIRQLLPLSVENETMRIVHQCDVVLGAFLRGQLLVMFLLGTTYAFGLWMVGLDFAILVGLLSGLASIVPYLGFIVGFSAASLIAFFQFGDILHLVLVLGVFTIGQMLESMIFTPLLVGDRIGLHPVAVIFAILMGAQLFGFVGMLLALPLAAIIKVLISTVHQRYLHSDLYSHEPDEAPVQDKEHSA